MRKWLRHETPWGVQYSEFFITICTRPKGFNQLCWPERLVPISHTISEYHRRGRWFCSIALWMPDHIHLIVQPNEQERFSQLIGDFKRILGKIVGICWHRGFFDHRIRCHESFEQKRNYIEQNPVRACLLPSSRKWPYQWKPDTQSFGTDA